MESIVVSEVTPGVAKNGNNYKKLVLSDGRAFTVFDNNCVIAEAGGAYNAEIGTDKKGHPNIVKDSMKMTGMGEVTQPVAQASSAAPAQGRSNGMNESIEKQVALKEVGEGLRTEYVTAGKDKDIFVRDDVRELYWNCLKELLTPQAPPPTGHLVAAVEEVGGVARVETAGEFMTICMKTWELGKTEVERMLGRQLESINDFTKALLFVRDKMNEPKQENFLDE